MKLPINRRPRRALVVLPANGGLLDGSGDCTSARSIECGFLAPSSVSEEVSNADASRRLLSLRRDQLQRRQPHAVPVSALLLLDLPQERGWRRIRGQYHGHSRYP